MAFFLPVTLTAHAGVFLQEKKVFREPRSDDLCTGCLFSIAKPHCLVESGGCVLLHWKPPSVADKPFFGYMDCSVCHPATVTRDE